MKRHVLGAAIATALSVPYTYAASYQVELGGSSGTIESDTTETDFTGVYLQYHLDSVDISKGPWAEAAFLNKSTFLRVDYRETDNDIQDADDFTDTSLFARALITKDAIVELSYTDGEFDERYHLGIGTYLTDNVDVLLSYSDTDETDESSTSLDVHVLNPSAADSALALDAGIAYLDHDEQDGYALRGGLDYYFNRQFSLGGQFSYDNVGDLDTKTTTLRATVFVTKNIKLGIVYNIFDAENVVDEPETLAFNAALRF